MSARQLPDGVKATSGGTFDPDEGLMFYIASNPKAVYRSRHRNVLVAVNELETGRDFEILDRLCDERNVLLDSGIFNLAMTHARNHETTHDEALSLPPEEIDGFEELWNRYGEIVARYSDRLWGVIELDQGGIAHKPRTRERIESDLGITPIPVYHPLLDGWDYYDTLAAGYDRICFGNLVKAPPNVRLRLIHTASERARAYPYLWTHLLGVYPNENLLAMPLRGSCDSSSWLVNIRWAPSWKAWSALRMVSDYPPAMWHANDGQANGSRPNANEVNAITCSAVSLTLEALAEDTHPHLAGSLEVAS